MEEVIVLGIIAFIAIISAVLISIHLDKIRDQAYEDKKIVLHKWLVYAKLKLDYECGEGETIVCIDEVEEALGIKLEDTDSDTFSGYALAIYGSVPDDGSNFELSTENLDIVIEEIKDHRIDRATVSIRQEDSSNTDNEEKED